MQIDILGLENICKYIEATKLSKFTIQRGGSGQYIPVFECINSDSNANALHEFKKWADVVNQNIPYKIVLFDFAEIIQDENGADKIKKSKSKSNKMEAVFMINSALTSMQTNQTNQTQQNNFGNDLQTLRADIIKEISQANEKNEILNHIKSLEAKINLMEEEDEEEEDEIEEEGSIAGIKPSQLSQIASLVAMFKTPSQPPVINGVDEVKDNINNAIKRLYKINKNLDTDLLKLAEIGETKPELFNMLLENLRTL